MTRRIRALSEGHGQDQRPIDRRLSRHGGLNGVKAIFGLLPLSLELRLCRLGLSRLGPSCLRLPALS